jgi:hypothetical protein
MSQIHREKFLKLGRPLAAILACEVVSSDRSHGPYASTKNALPFTIRRSCQECPSQFYCVPQLFAWQNVLVLVVFPSAAWHQFAAWLM